jgi:transcriptional regulator of acetoin/glycerol metabolism
MLSQSVLPMRNAWISYVESEKLDVQYVRPEVAESWRRCRTLTVKPYPETGGRIDELKLKDRLCKKQQLLNVARPLLKTLYNLFTGSGFQVVLTDESGFLLEVFGDEEIVTRTKAVHLCPGGNWSEPSKGTNAIGTAIVERKPVQIHAFEHYCEPHHFLTCSAVPLFDPEAQMTGILDITGDYHVANAHTTGMVVAAATSIENQLRAQRATSKLYVSSRYASILAERMADGVIAVDKDGLVTELNAKSGQILGVEPSHAKGRHISQVCQDCSSLLGLLAGQTEHDYREFVMPNTRYRIQSSTSLLRDEKGEIAGAVAVLRAAGGVQCPVTVASTGFTFEDIVGNSPAIRDANNWAKLAASSSSTTVLITGGTGTGKELFARAIHNASQRRHRRFVALNCAAVPEHLIESELFGYEDGAFTGARKGGHAGKFEIADGGTLFFDEVGDMSLTLQAKLLRLIQERTVVRLGSVGERRVDIRIIAATNKDLRAAFQQGKFREDLYYRLNVLEIRIPSLAERVEDIAALTKHLSQKIAVRLDTGPIRVLDDCIRKIESLTWPGNIRELENALERAILRRGQCGDLTADLFECSNPGLAVRHPNIAAVKSLREFERDSIGAVLSLYEGNIQRAANKLGICRNTLYRKMKEYNISPRPVGGR